MLVGRSLACAFGLVLWTKGDVGWFTPLGKMLLPRYGAEAPLRDAHKAPALSLIRSEKLEAEPRGQCVTGLEPRNEVGLLTKN